MVKTQVYLGPEELEALHQVAARADRSVADLIREAKYDAERRVCLALISA